MPGADRSVACDACQTPLPAGARFCPGCGHATVKSGDEADGLGETVYEGPRLAAGKTLMGGVAFHEVLLGVRRAAAGRLRPGGGRTVIDVEPSVDERATAPEGVDAVRVKARAQVLEQEAPPRSTQTSAQASAQASAPRSPEAPAGPDQGGRPSRGTLWRRERLRELIAHEEERGLTRSHENRPSGRRSTEPRRRGGVLASSAVRIAVIAAVVIVGVALAVVLGR